MDVAIVGGIITGSRAEAIDQIAEIRQRFGIECGFERLPGYLYTESEEHVDNLARELDAARRARVAVQQHEVPLPFATRAVLRFENQGQSDPLASICGPAGKPVEQGLYLFEGARVIAIDGRKPCRVHLERGAVVTWRGACSTGPPSTFLQHRELEDAPPGTPRALQQAPVRIARRGGKECALPLAQYRHAS